MTILQKEKKNRKNPRKKNEKKLQQKRNKFHIYFTERRLSLTLEGKTANSFSPARFANWRDYFRQYTRVLDR
jgi:hypothetical protein